MPRTNVRIAVDRWKMMVRKPIVHVNTEVAGTEGPDTALVVRMTAQDGRSAAGFSLCRLF
jgi:hypothetical protein